MPRASKITVVSTFTSKNFGECAQTIKVGGKTTQIERVNKELLGNNEWSAKDKPLVIQWAKFTLNGAEYNRGKADRNGWSVEVKRKLSLKITKCRALIEALTGEAMAITKATKPKTKTKTKPKGSKVSAELAKTLAGLSPELQSAFLAMMKAQK